MEAFAVRVKNEQDIQSAITLFERKELAEELRIECIHATDDYDCLLSAILEKGFRGFIYAVSNTAVLPLKWLDAQGRPNYLMQMITKLDMDPVPNTWHPDPIQLDATHTMKFIIPAKSELSIYFSKNELKLF